MKLRCELHLESTLSRVILVPKQEEKLDHLALKLAAFAMFLPKNPIVEPSSRHPSLSQVDIRPDVMAVNDAGEINLWIECGFVTIHKVDKITRRFPNARVVVLKALPREAERLRKDLVDNIRHHKRVEIWSWPEGEFQTWLSAIEEKTEIFGEVQEKSFNVVVNNVPIVTDLIAF